MYRVRDRGRACVSALSATGYHMCYPTCGLQIGVFLKYEEGVLSGPKHQYYDLSLIHI